MRTGISGVAGLWRMLIRSCTTMLAYGVRDISRCSSEQCASSQADCSGHAGKHAAEWCGQNFHEVSCEERTQLIRSTFSTQSSLNPINPYPTSSIEPSTLSTPAYPISPKLERLNLAVPPSPPSFGSNTWMPIPKASSIQGSVLEV